MYERIADRLLQGGGALTAEEGRSILQADDTETLKIVDAAWKLRRHYFGNSVKVNVLSNSKSGACTEDCHYCSQSIKSDSGIQRFAIVRAQEIVDQAVEAWKNGGQRFCITMAVRSASWSQVSILATAIQTIKHQTPLEVCVCVGLMTGDVGKKKLEVLKEAGADAYNHNLNTAEANYASICSTHTYQDRLETLKNARELGYSTCSGVILGMGETDEQTVEIALALRDENVKSIPVNFLIPVPGTLQAEKPTTQPYTAWKALRALALFRFAHPSAELRASAGREIHLRTLQPLALLVANSIFLGGYLTQDGQEESEDWKMIQDLGLTPQDLGHIEFSLDRVRIASPTA